MAIVIRLKEIREDRGLTQRDLAHLVDMTEQGIQKIEYGQLKSYTVRSLNALCWALNCEPGDLLKYVPDESN